MAAGAPRQRPHRGNAGGNRHGAAAAARLGLGEARDAGVAQRLGRPGSANGALAGQDGRKPFDQVPQSSDSIYSFAPYGRPTPAHHRPRCRARIGSSVAPARSPWLHEEVARRMEDRLQWIRLRAQGLGRLGAGAGRPAGPGAARAPLPPGAECFVAESQREPRRGGAGAARQAVVAAAGRPHGIIGPLPDAGVQMLWANMALHMSADPQALIAQWHRALATDGFLMFSCLGPDTLRELRALYAALGWPPAGARVHRHARLGRHAGSRRLRRARHGHGAHHPDLGNARRGCWRNCANSAPTCTRGALRPCAAAAGGPGWTRSWRTSLRGPDGRLALTFEIIYGHALKPAPRVRMSEHSAVSLQDMRAMLRRPDKRPRQYAALRGQGCPGRSPRYNAGLIF